MEKEWTNLSEVDFTMTGKARIDTRDFKVLVTEGTGERTMDELLKEGLSEKNFIDGEDLMEFLFGLKKRNREKPLWIGNANIKYIALERCLDDHWLVMDRNGDPVEWRKI